MVSIRKLATASRALRSAVRWRYLYHNFRILADGYGLENSLRMRRPIDATGAPLPWFTFPAIDYLKQLDFRNQDIFEYGCGHSSLFWSARANTVTSVESDEQWYRELKSKSPENLKVLLRQSKQEYIDAIDEPGRDFDVVVIDGMYRLSCVEPALRRLKKNGMLIVDNADWLPRVIASCRSKELMEFSFSGFGPGVPYTWVTAIYITPAFRPAFINPSRIAVPAGGIDQVSLSEN